MINSSIELASWSHFLVKTVPRANSNVKCGIYHIIRGTLFSVCIHSQVFLSRFTSDDEPHRTRALSICSKVCKYEHNQSISLCHTLGHVKVFHYGAKSGK